MVDHARLFFKKPGVGWRFRIHEQILPSLREAGGKLVFTDIVLSIRLSKPDRARPQTGAQFAIVAPRTPGKARRSLYLFNLGGTYIDAGDLGKARTYLKDCIAKSHKGATFLAKAYVLLAQVERGQGRFNQALRCCAEAKTRFPKDAELWFEEGTLYYAKKDFAAAPRCFEQILKLPKRPSYVGTDSGLRPPDPPSAGLNPPRTTFVGQSEAAVARSH